MTQPDSPHDTYQSPLATRNASPEMLRIWSARHKFDTWRRIWLAVAEAQHEVTKNDKQPLVTKDQVEELRAVAERGISDEEIERASELERELRHDVMAHVHCLGEQCPKAKPIIHLGCTSQDVVCNADLILIINAAQQICFKIETTIRALATQAGHQARLPMLGFTHYQAAQPTTMGRRLVQWAYELELTCERVRWYRDAENGVEYPLRGLRGATGTQASFLKLMNGDQRKVWMLEQLFVSGVFHLTQEVRAGLGAIRSLHSDWHAEHRAWLEKTWSEMSTDQLPSSTAHLLTGQTYPRVVDTFILSDLAAIASVLHKIATDIRLLSNRKEIDEPFGDKQIGSSAMPYKRNPMRCERICGLTRFVMNLVGNAYDTAATQWLERTLDDSSNRRLSLPEAFLALDGALDLMHNVASGLVVHEAMVRRNLMAELPFLATENILMEAVKLGGDRQDLHEKIRVHAQEAGLRVKRDGLDNDLIERLKADPAFAPPTLGAELDWEGLMDPMRYVGRAVEQTERFIAEVVEPLRERYGDEVGAGSEPRV